MTTVSSLGVGSGLDLSSIITGLVDAERVPVENRLATRQEDATIKLSAFGALRSSLSLFQGSYADLKFASTYNAKQVSLSDESVFSASVNTNANLGSYSVEVTELAKSHSLASAETSAFDSVDDAVGSGVLTVSFGTTTTGPYAFNQDTSKATQTITISEANNNTTLSGLKDYINDNDFGFQAAIINDGNGYRLVFTSEQTGASNSMQITVDDDDGIDDDNSGLSQFAFNASAQSMTQTVAAQDASLIINGLSITRESNTVSGAIDGVTLNLSKADPGNPISLTVDESSNEVKTAINEFVEGYNGLIANINSLTNYNAETETAGVLLGDFTVRNISNQLRNLLSRQVPGISGDIDTLADIGITTRTDGTLTIDDTKLAKALENDSEAVKSLFMQNGVSSNNQVSFLDATTSTVAGSYIVDISQVATRGVFNGSTVNSLTINANNDEFTISVDGVTSNNIILNQQLYADGGALAAHIQAQINNDSNLKDNGVSVSVVYDSINNEFDFISQQYGSSSTIEFISVDTDSANDLGITTGSGIAGVDVAGTINGNPATGSGQVLTSTGGETNGLSLLIESSQTGNLGSVNFAQGMIGRLDTLLDSFIKSDGYIETREEGLNDELEEIDEEFVKLNERLTSLEDRLIRQFSALDALLAQLNSTSSFLSEQLSNLPEPNSISKNK